jgi:hypothetical protein
MKGGNEMREMKGKALIVSMITILAFLGPLLGLIGKLTAQQTLGLPTIQQAVICGKVENRAPTGIGEVFPATVEKLYCFTQLKDIPSEGKLYHIWYHGDKEMARVELSLSPPQWRTWSSKIILPDWKGGWKVEVVYGDHVLETLAFTIQ